MKSGDKVVLLLLVVVSLFCGFCFGMGVGNEKVKQVQTELFYEIWNPVKPPMEITVEQGLQYLLRAKRSHQQFIDRPELMEEYCHEGEESQTEFHQGCVDRYDALGDLIVRLNGGLEGD